MITIDKQMAKGMLRLAALLVVLGLSAWVGYALAARVYRSQLSALQTKLAAAEARASRAETSFGDLTEATRKQNTAVAGMAAETEKRKQAAEQLVAAAAGQAAGYDARASEILAATADAGNDPCAAAQAAFDAELKAERGGG